MSTFWNAAAKVASLIFVAGLASLLTHCISGPEPAVRTERMLDSSVTIKVISQVRTDRYGDSVWDASFGSGLLVSATPCEVWTNQHVVKDAAIIRVIPRGIDISLGITASVVHSTTRPDIAVLALDHCDSIEVATLGDSDLIHAGMEVFAVGNPLGNNPDSISRGIISHATRTVGMDTFLQTDANINPGNSGGALFDRRGYVIGMNTALASNKDGGRTGIGYAIPVNRVTGAIERLRANAPGWGISGIADMASNLTTAEAAAFKVPDSAPAVILTRVPESGPGVGRFHERDVIHRIDDVSVMDVQHLKRLFAERDPGSVVELSLIRDGKPLAIALTLEDGYQSAISPQPEPYEGLLGLKLEDWSDRDLEKGKFESPVITRLHSMGPAHLAEISSSQHSVALNGTKFVEFLLDAKTITGVVLDGKYQPISDIASIDHYSAEAHARRVPLLLEIQQWARRDPRNAKSELVHRNTAFFKIDPAPGTKPTEPAQAAANSSNLEAHSVPTMILGEDPI